MGRGIVVVKSGSRRPGTGPVQARKEYYGINANLDTVMKTFAPVVHMVYLVMKHM